jgi:alkanesulfonate monooxygenase SsuD/methylene tetrahydromethanopterin reductase-like flavin-dependent oxidoreductase (luciferase family)
MDAMMSSTEGKDALADRRDQDRTIEFGIALPVVGRNIPTAEFLHEITAEVVAAEDAGLDLCLVPEHHGGPSAALTDPMLTVTWLLARTRRIRVGTGVLILPLHSIPRLAEQAAVLQHASGGRLILGIGVGYQPQDFATFGVDLGARSRLMDAGIAQLKQAWRTGDLAGHPIRPELGSMLAPELHLGAWTTRGLRRAALEADGWIADPIRTLDETAAAALAYRALSRDAGRPSQVTVMREAWIADSDEAAEAAFGPIIEPIFRYYLRHGAFPRGHGLSESDLTLPCALANRVLAGSVPTMIERTVTLVEQTGADTVVFGLRHPAGPAHSEVMGAISLVGREVLPAVRSRLAGRRVTVP